MTTFPTYIFDIDFVILANIIDKNSSNIGIPTSYIGALDKSTYDSQRLYFELIRRCFPILNKVMVTGIDYKISTYAIDIGPQTLEIIKPYIDEWSALKRFNICDIILNSLKGRLDVFKYVLTKCYFHSHCSYALLIDINLLSTIVEYTENFEYVLYYGPRGHTGIKPNNALLNILYKLYINKSYDHIRKICKYIDQNIVSEFLEFCIRQTLFDRVYLERIFDTMMNFDFIVPEYVSKTMLNLVKYAKNIDGLIYLSKRCNFVISDITLSNDILPNVRILEYLLKEYSPSDKVLEHLDSWFIIFLNEYDKIWLMVIILNSEKHRKIYDHIKYDINVRNGKVNTKISIEELLELQLK